MRNSSVEYVNSVMNDTFVEYQRSPGFMGVDFDALVRHNQQNCRFVLKYAS